MKTIFTTVLLSVLSSSVSFANPAASSSPNTPLPIRSDALKLSPNVKSCMERKVVKMDDAVGSYCTAFPITEDGYFLTALHCVTTCLTYQGLAENASNEAVGLNDLLVVRNPSRTAAKCPNLSVPSLGIQGMEIVATGSGISVFTSKFMQSSPKLFEELKSQGWNAKSNDFALLKAQPRERLQCMKVSLVPVGSGQKIWSVGFPLPQPSKDKDGKIIEPVLSASSGVRYRTVAESLIYRNQTTDEGREWIREQYQDRRVLFSSAHNNEGQSGGPIIAQDGTVVGVTSGFTITTDKNKTEVHELVASSTLSILRSLPTDLMDMLLRKNSDCKK